MCFICDYALCKNMYLKQGKKKARKIPCPGWHSLIFFFHESDSFRNRIVAVGFFVNKLTALWMFDNVLPDRVSYRTPSQMLHRL